MFLAILGGFSPISLGAAETTPSSAGTSATRSGPIIQFDATTFDFGKVSSGAMVKHDFVFTNIGNATLENSDVHPGCGCTTAGDWDRQVAPGKTGKIPLQFNSSGYGGGVTKSTTVTCNDPAQSNIVLQLTGTIWKPIDVSPSMAIFNVSSEAPMLTNEMRSVRIVNNTEQDITLSDLQCTNATFRAELKTVRPGKEFELQVTAVPPFNGSYVLAPITLKSSSAQMPLISLNAYVAVQQAVVIMPQQIMLPSGPLASATSSSITIRNSGTNSLVLKDAKANVPGVEVKVEEVQPGKLFTIVAQFPAGWQLASQQKAEVTVKSNHPKFASITIPVFQQQTFVPSTEQRVSTTPTVVPTAKASPVRSAK